MLPIYNIVLWTEICTNFIAIKVVLSEKSLLFLWHFTASLFSIAYPNSYSFNFKNFTMIIKKQRDLLTKQFRIEGSLH